MATPTPPTSHQNKLPSRPQVRPLESDAALVSVKRSSVFMLLGGWGWLLGQGFDLSEAADANGAVGIEAEDFEEGENDGRSSRDDCAANDGHLALVNVATPDGKAAVDDARNAEHETEHHDDGEAVADAGLEVGGTERCALRESGAGIECEEGGSRQQRGKPRANFGTDVFDHFHKRCVFVFLSSFSDFCAESREHNLTSARVCGV